MTKKTEKSGNGAIGQPDKPSKKAAAARVTVRRARKKDSAVPAPDPSGQADADNTLLTSYENRLKDMRDEYEKARKSLDLLRVRHETCLEELKHMEMLLSAFNAMTDDGQLRLSVPSKRTPYFYLRASVGTRSFEVQSCEWIDGISDRFRFVKGNYFMDRASAEVACNAVNGMLCRLFD